MIGLGLRLGLGLGLGLDRGAALLGHPIEHVTPVDLDADDVDHLAARQLVQGAAHHVAQLVEEVHLLLLRLAHRRLLSVGDGVQRLG